MTPFITFYTPTYRRPRGLAACLESVRTQTAVDAIEQIVIPDHIGIGIAGMYRSIPDYADCVHGDYVHVLADDDVLASPTVVEQVRDFARKHDHPALILVAVRKNGSVILPSWPPALGAIDLGNMIVRGDVWEAHAGAYGSRYEGDYDFAAALHASHVQAARMDLLFLSGAVMGGQAEVAA